MLKKFVVTNFKNYKSRTEFDLGSPSNYEFNSSIVADNGVSKAIIYGINGSGKSNLGLALFDIIFHLTDKERIPVKYIPYLNMESEKPMAEFEYHFSFGDMSVSFFYGKTDVNTLTYEKVIINGQEVLNYDYLLNAGYTSLAGAESLNLNSNDSVGGNKISRVRFIKGSALGLVNNEVNKAFIDFTTFVDNMLMFFSLDEKGYQGLCVGSDSYTQGIIRENKLTEFETFLRDKGIDYKLVAVNISGITDLYCKYPKGIVPFATVASTGTKSLALFYYWYIKMQKASFVYIDEFDAFYHFALSQSLVELVKKLNKTQVVLSTHNTDLMSNDLLRPDAYFIIQNNRIKALDTLVDKDIRRAHNIQKMYRAGTFDE